MTHRPHVGLAVLLTAPGCAAQPSDAAQPRDTAPAADTGRSGPVDSGEAASEATEATITFSLSWVPREEGARSPAGTAWVALFDEPLGGMPTELTATPIAWSSATAQSGATAGEAIGDVVVEGVPIEGTLYSVLGFIDVQGDADPGAPLPSAGDAWARGGNTGYPNLAATSEAVSFSLPINFILPQR